MQVGDLVNENTGTGVNDASADAEAVAWMNSLPVQPWYGAIGNHDIYNNNRTVAAAVAAFGIPGKNYTVDFSFARMIVLGPDSLVAGLTRISLAQATLDYLDAQLAGTTKPCVIVCHAPLFNTHLIKASGGHSTDPDSIATDFWIAKDGGTVDTAIRTILGNHTNANAWVSGHIHLELSYTTDELTNIVKAETVGSRTIAAVSCPSPAYSGVATGSAYSSAYGTYLTVLADRVQVRYRNHTSRCWDAPFEGATPTITPKIVYEVPFG